MPNKFQKFEPEKLRIFQTNPDHSPIKHQNTQTAVEFQDFSQNEDWKQPWMNPKQSADYFPENSNHPNYGMHMLLIQARQIVSIKI